MKKIVKVFTKIIAITLVILTMQAHILIAIDDINAIEQNDENLGTVLSDDRIHFIALGPSDATLIESNGHYGLVDAGNPSNLSSGIDIYKFNGLKVKQYLTGMGVTHLDFIVFTHAHSDHIGGISDIRDFINSNTVVFYKPFETTLNTSNPSSTEEASWKSEYCLSTALSVVDSKGGYKFNTTSSIDSQINTAKGKNANLKNMGHSTNASTSTNADETIYFDFGDFKITLYNLFHVCNNDENANSIVTLVTKGTQKTVLTADINNRTDLSSGDTSKSISKQIANAIGQVTVYKAAHHRIFRI